MTLNDYKNWHRLTLRQMSDDTGLSITLLSKLCNGRCPLTSHSYSILVKTYGIEFEGLQEPKILATKWKEKYQQEHEKCKLLYNTSKEILRMLNMDRVQNVLTKVKENIQWYEESEENNNASKY